MPPYQPDQIADYLLVESRERGELLTNLKLQKLMYYADAWHLALYGEELFSEPFKAWVHGPVLLSQYHRFKHFGWREITDEVSKPELDERVSAHLDEIIDVFGSETAVALEIMTHEERPWIEARAGLGPTEPSQAVISKATTRSYYRQLQ